jgi:hypothetical protein
VEHHHHRTNVSATNAFNNVQTGRSTTVHKMRGGKRRKRRRNQESRTLPRFARSKRSRCPRSSCSLVLRSLGIWRWAARAREDIATHLRHQHRMVLGAGLRWCSLPLTNCAPQMCCTGPHRLLRTEWSSICTRCRQRCPLLPPPRCGQDCGAGPQPADPTRIALSQQ